MNMNELPKYDQSVNTTGCCPRFNPAGWDGQELHFDEKPFVKAKTRSAMHIPLNMGKVFSRVQQHIQDSDAFDPDNYIVMSRDTSPWTAEHFFAVTKPVPDEENVTLSGDFVTKVFEGPYSAMGRWFEEMQDSVRARKKTPGEVYFFYTTCPRCAKAYGENYVVGVAAV